MSSTFFKYIKQVLLRRPEAEFLNFIGTKVWRISLLAIHKSPLLKILPPPLSKSGLKLVCNVQTVYGNFKSEYSQDYAQKPQRNYMFMNSASVLSNKLFGLSMNFSVPTTATECQTYTETQKNSIMYNTLHALIKKKTKFSSDTRKFRWDQVQSHMWGRASLYIWGNAQIFSPYMRRSLVMTLHPIPLNFLKYEETFIIFFISVVDETR